MLIWNLTILLSGFSTQVPGATGLSYKRRAHVHVLIEIDFSSLSSFTRTVKKS